ncbi:hypothetical protein HS088_TW05G00404 [Tripterygium wilfordii]|uniref:DUF7356 domain-containing protein n=1 Tax=Tripterygium wilfordii TaxID=458696 RepID=A0A7J7DMX9_TRIWF|nr:uncharacterized protein LOC119998920 [Tripterygium wilfordii]KAF5747677.1 hypothetical protein HS088_TW05G00404 [Tripterygium wilfordii]
MDRNLTLAVLFLFLIVTDVSSASLLSRFRYLVAVDSSNNNNKSALSEVSPSPSPVSTIGASHGNSSNDSKKDPPVPNSNDPQKVDHTGSSKKGSGSSNPQNGTNGANDQETKKNEDKTMSASVIGENCTGLPKKCKDLNSLVACIPNFLSGLKEYGVLVQNIGDIALNVNLTLPGSLENYKSIEIPKHHSQKINVTVGESTKLIFVAGNGECVLHIGPGKSEDKFFLRLPSYEKLVTPINGAYFLIFTVIIFGGAWACCKFRKKRYHGDVPYQELEMGLPESHMDGNGESAEGWDQGWDDDWDEETAVKSPVSRPVGNISANGLTSRASNKDEWQNDWDD